MSDNELKLVEQYLAGKLSGDALYVFEQRLQDDKTFYQEVLAHQHVQGALENQAYNAFAKNLKAIAENALKKAEKTYSLDELMAMFEIVEDYEEVLSPTRSSGDLTVLNPKNGADCTYEFILKLQQKINTALTLVIENNEEDAVMRHEIAAETQKFICRTNMLRPGRYYWKLFGQGYSTIIGSFFIEKFRMPKDLV